MPRFNLARRSALRARFQPIIELLESRLAPAVAISAPNLIADDDSGTSSTDNLTNLTIPTFSGTAEVGATVQLLEGTTLLGSTVATDGTWTITVTSALGDGAHPIFARATNTVESSDSTALTVTIDTIAPAVSAPNLSTTSDTGLSNSDNITTDTTPTFTGTAAVGISVQLWADSTLRGTDTATDGTWSITPTMPAGVHNFFARVSDAAGNVNNSSLLSITIDVTPPAFSVPDLDASSDGGISNLDNLTNDTTPTFFGLAESGATVEVRAGGTLLATGTVSGNLWVITTGTMGNGTHQVFARTRDVAGNSVDSATLSITIDAAISGSAPDLTAASDTGISTTDNITGNATPTFTGTAELGATVELREGSTVLTTVAVGGSSTWTITTSTLPSGVRQLFTRTSDAAGNSVDSATLTVTIDTTTSGSPADLVPASDTGISAIDDLTTDTTPTFSGTAEAGTTVELYGPTLMATTTATGGVWSMTPSLPPGTYAVFARVIDVAGNTFNTTTLTVTIDTSVTISAPDLDPGSDSGVSSLDNLTNDTTPTFSGTAEPGATIELREGAIVLGTTVALDGTWMITSSTLLDGLHPIVARATDAAGNTMDSAPLSVTIDTVTTGSTPDLDPASDIGSSATDNLTSDATPTFNGTAQAGAMVELRTATAVLGTGSPSSGTWSITTVPLANGTYPIFARVIDPAGNSFDTAPLAVTIATLAAPDLDTDSGVSSLDNLTNDNTPTFSGTAAVGVTVELWEGITLLGSVVVTDGTWAITSTPLVDGVHEIFVKVINAGTFNYSAPLLVTIDTSVPSVTINQAALQSDPTAGLDIQFIVVFSEPVSGFTAAGVTLGGSAGASTVLVSESGPLDGTTYTLVVSGMSQSGTVSAVIAAGAAQDDAGNTSLLSSSSDNQVSFEPTLFAVGQGKGGTGQASVLHAFDHSARFSLTPYSGFSGDVRVAMGDVNNDGTPDLITAPGRGWQGQVRVFDGQDGTPLGGTILPFGPKWKKGLFVAAGDTNNDGHAEIIVGQDKRGGQVRIFDGATGSRLRILRPFGRLYRGGVSVAAGDTDLDGRAEIIAGQLTGKPLVRVFQAIGGPPLRTWNAFVGVNRGVYVAAGDLDGDGRAEVITSMAGGNLNHVCVFDAGSGAMQTGTTALDSSFTGGVRVAAVDLDGDGLAEVFAGAGPCTSGPRVEVLNGQTLVEVDAFFADAPNFAGGLFVGG